MSDVARTIEAVWRIESTRLIAAMARVTRDIGIAEELAQDALVAALERWPEAGIPENPAAWLRKYAEDNAAATGLGAEAAHFCIISSVRLAALWSSSIPAEDSPVPDSNLR